MGKINYYFIEDWKRNDGIIFKFNNVSFEASISKETQRWGKENKYSEYHILELYTKFKKYKFTVHFNLIMDSDNKLIRTDDELHLSEFTWFQEVSDFDKRFQLITDQLNSIDYYVSNETSFVKLEREQGKYYPIDGTRVECLNKSPYKLLCAELLYTNDNNEECQVLGINWYINDEVRLQFIIDNIKTTEKRIIKVPDYENYPSEPTLRLEKEIEDTYSNESAYLKITNKKTRQTQKFYYHEKLGIV